MSTSEQDQSLGGGEKSKKYDRQLRLWGDHGQSALEKARVCLINATATGTEILKNLILPGVGSFTIVDGGTVTEEDTGNNFFYEKDSVGKPRAQVATEFLQELNDDVSGDFLEENLQDLLESNSSFFTHFSIVIASSVPEKLLLRLASLLGDHDLPLLVCTSYGFIGYLRLVVKEHTVAESHPDNAHEDLRLDRPFPGLVQFCDSLDMDQMTKKDHSHTPWLIIIYKYIKKWMEEHDGKPPRTYKEKKQLKEEIRQGIRCNEEGLPELEENFDEAIRNVNTSLVPTKIPSQIVEIFEDEQCKNLDQDSRPFWILARAVKDFVSAEGQGALPLRGSIPDMTSDSERYIALQQVYRDQASADIIAVTQHIHRLLETLGREELVNVETRSQPSSPQKPQDGIAENDIKLFCKNASFLRVIRCHSLADEYATPNDKTQQLGLRLENEDDDGVHYVMLRSVQRFHSEFSRYPGEETEAMETDIPKLKTFKMTLFGMHQQEGRSATTKFNIMKSTLNKVLQELGVPATIKDDYVHEYCRYGAAEMHSVAAYMGGTAAQEIIKVLTQQFVPINNTFIYNAMRQTSVTLEL